MGRDDLTAGNQQQDANSRSAETEEFGLSEPEFAPIEQKALLEARVRQQAAVADLGQMALGNTSFQTLLDSACARIAETLGVELVKVLELQPDGTNLLLRSGVGWQSGLVGTGTVSAGLESQAGYTLSIGQPVIVKDLRTESRFNGPKLLFDHGVISGISVIIRGQERPFGVLGAHTRKSRSFTSDDLYFVRSIANVLAMTAERLRVDAALHLRHQEFRALVENAPDIITRVDREFRHLFINRAIEQYVDIPFAEFVGKSNRELGMDPGLVDDWDDALEAVFQTGQEHWIEFSFKGQDGVHWFQARMAPEFDLDGNVRTALAVTRDITQQHEALAQLRDSEERFRSLSTSSPVGIVVSDVRGHLTYVNPRCEEITGAPMSRALGRGWLTLIHKDDRAGFLELCERAFAAGGDAEAEIRVLASEHHETWVLVRASPMYDDHSEIAGYVATLQDITERKLVERRLRFLAEAGAVITQSLEVGTTAKAITEFAVPEFADYCMVQVYDADTRLSDVMISHVDRERGPGLIADYRKNVPTYRDPHPMARVLRTRLPELLPSIDEEDWARFASSPEHLELIRKFAPRSVMILPMIARNQLLGTISFLYTDSGRRYTDVDLELASDLADRSALAIDNARLYQDAQQAIRTREEFLSIASHELKTPLTSVKGYAQLLEMAAESANPDPGRVHNAAIRVREQVERLEALINDLLDVSRIQQGQLDLRLTYIDLVRLANDVIERFRESTDITDEHTVEIVAARPVVGVWDAERLDQVLTNLVSNALKYSPDGGRVTIEVQRDGAAAVLAVGDEGIGISDEDKRDLFQPFMRTRRNPAHVTGTGLGLFIVRQIVEQHGGGITVESQVGKGSRFIVRLPIDSSPPQVSRTTRQGSLAGDAAGGAPNS